MSVIEFNKIAGAILLALFVSKVSDLAGESLGKPKPLGKPAYMTGEMPAQAEASAPAKGDQAESAKGGAPAQVAAIAPLLAKADVDAGKSAARKCVTCHSLEKGGKAKVGPPLWGIVGDRKAAGDFRYSEALKGLGGAWDYESLNAYLADPRAYAPGTKMIFPGIRSASERAAVIAYLRTLADSPLPLP